jgi:GNAT superfamily N-acetyltransferase
VEFRAAAPSDVAALAALLSRASPGRTLEAECSYVGGYFERPETVIGIALRDAEAVGVVSFEPSLVRGDPGADERTAYLRLIATHPSLWGTGLANELLEWAETRMVAAGFARAYLWCARSNGRARRFYERAGWTADGRRSQHEDWGPMLGYAKQVRDAHADV